MTFDELLAELKRLSITVTVNGQGRDVLNVEPKDRVTPALETALREHKPALLAYITTPPSKPSVFDEATKLFEGLAPKPEPAALAHPLRRLATLVEVCDSLTRQLVRAHVIAALAELQVRGPAKIVDAALNEGVPGVGEDEVAGRPLILEVIEPWPSTVDGGDLLTALAATFTRHVVLPKHAETALGLWCVHAHAVGASDISPYLAITSPEKRCGKTTTLSIMGALVPRPIAASNISPAALFRAVEKYAPTLLVDEADTFLAEAPELRGLLNSGHTRTTAFVLRTAGEALEPRLFSTFCAKVIALIKDLPPTLEDRSIVISMRRKTKAEQVPSGPTPVQPVEAQRSVPFRRRRLRCQLGPQESDHVSLVTQRRYRDEGTNEHLLVTLDGLARDPAKAAALSVEMRAALLVQTAAVLVALGAGIMSQDEDARPDRLLDVKETATRLGLSRDYVYRHARDFPFFVQPNGGRAVRFSERGIARYLRQQQERQAP